MPSRALLLAWWWEPGGPGEPLEIRDPFAARALLARASRSSGDVGRLRGLLREWLAGPSRGLDDGQVLDQLAHCVVVRHLRLWELPQVRLTTWGEVEEEVPDTVFVEREAVAEEPAPVEEPTFPPGIDAEAIAAVLTQASAAGVPFCEECLKKQVPEPDTFPPNLDAAAVAAVLTEASKDGAPFCEECMKNNPRNAPAAQAAAAS